MAKTEVLIDSPKTGNNVRGIILGQLFDARVKIRVIIFVQIKCNVLMCLMCMMWYKS